MALARRERRMKIRRVTVARQASGGPAVGQRQGEGSLGRPCPLLVASFAAQLRCPSRSKGIRAAGTDPEAGTDLFFG